MHGANNQRWLQPYDWESVTWLNQQLCEKADAIHKLTSDGHDPARILWERSRAMSLPLERALLVCYECHQLAPFAFFNGNTFVAIARQMIEPILAAVAPVDPLKAAAFRAVVGHFVAGTEGWEELRSGIAGVSQVLEL